jgi:hypothetical protein
MAPPLIIKGLESTLKNLAAMAEVAKKVYRSAVRYEAEKIMTMSQEEVPVDTGNLKNSKFIEMNNKPDGADVTLGYRTDYAWYVHEIPPDRATHPVGKWKYLEEPMNRSIPGFDDRVAKKMLAELEAKGGKH